MEQLKEYFKESSAYWGDKALLNWPVLYTQNRDSDCLTRSNWEQLIKTFSTLFGEESFYVVNCAHWACGWLEYFLINPEIEKAIFEAEDIERALENYPVLNEEHFSELEMDEANQIWANCYDRKERAEYIRKNRSEFDFHSFQELREVLAGEYFIGYASELIY